MTFTDINNDERLISHLLALQALGDKDSKTKAISCLSQNSLHARFSTTDLTIICCNPFPFPKKNWETPTLTSSIATSQPQQKQGSPPNLQTRGKCYHPSFQYQASQELLEHPVQHHCLLPTAGTIHMHNQLMCISCNVKVS